MDVENGEILSLVSLPNFDINLRANLHENKYMNKITKGIYELGSIFKTFTIALALRERFSYATNINQKYTEIDKML